MRPSDPRLLDPVLLALAAKRLQHRAATGRPRYPWRVCYAGEPLPPETSPIALTIVVHRDFCQRPGHEGLCVQEEGL